MAEYGSRIQGRSVNGELIDQPVEGTIPRINFTSCRTNGDERGADGAGIAVLATIQKMVKQRRDSLQQFRDAGRDDLADKEEAEIGVLTAYLPTQLSANELDSLIDEVIVSVGASSPADMGKVMGALKSRAAGQADMGAASARVKARLQSS